MVDVLTSLVKVFVLDPGKLILEVREQEKGMADPRKPPLTRLRERLDVIYHTPRNLFQMLTTYPARRQ
jgi:hypothetical protein